MANKFGYFKELSGLRGCETFFFFVCTRNVHSVTFEDLEHFVAHGGYVTFDLVDVILGNGTLVVLTMLGRHITPHQRSHYV